ncbi:hypothetical protein JCM8208_002220 [Rhodotorula glutinis]
MLARIGTRSPLPRATTTPRLSPPSSSSSWSPSPSSSPRRQLSSASPPATPTDTAQLLQDLRNSLNRYPLVDPVWPARIDTALADLVLARPARLAVVGDHASDAPGLVTALLDDPLASNPDVTVALEARRLGSATHEALTIKHGNEVSSSPSEVHVPAPWLHDTNAEVVEIVHGDVAPLESSLSSLHLADLVVLVLSDSTLLSSRAVKTLLYDLAAKPNLLLALNCPDASPSTSASPLRTLEHQLETLFPADAEPRAIAVSTAQALAALEALSPSEPDQQPNYDAFQKGYVASQVPHLHQLLTTALTATHADHLPHAPTPLQLQTAQYVLAAALSRAAFAGARVADALDGADAHLSALEAHADEAERALLVSLGVEPSTGLVRVPPDELAVAMGALDELFATRLAWYKVPYRVDDLGAEVALVASQTFLTAFERRLAFSAGLAASTASSLSHRVDALYASPQFATSPTRVALDPPTALSSLYSATLRNALDKASAASAPQAHPDSKDATALSGAVAHRRAQLTAPAGSPTAQLHERAQRAVVRSGVLASASVAGGIAADALGWVAQTGTSVGAGLLGVTLAAWGLQRAWLSALGRFRKDVERVVGGLEEDLGIRAQSVAKRAGWKASVAVRLGRERVRERRREWDAWRSEWGRIERGAAQLREGAPSVGDAGAGGGSSAPKRRAEA